MSHLFKQSKIVFFLILIFLLTPQVDAENNNSSMSPIINYLLSDSEVITPPIVSTIDIAHTYGKATQGTDSSYYYYGSASNIIDNNDATYNHTDGGENGENWVQIELPNPTIVHRILLQSRASNASRLEGAKVYISNTPYDGSIDMNTSLFTLSGTSAEQNLTLETPISGKYLIIKNEDSLSNSKHLHLTKVEVYGELPASPLFNDIEESYFVSESAINGSIVATIGVEDFQGDSLTYSIIGTVPFTIDNNGTITVNGVLDYGTYTFDVMVSDGENSTTTSITIQANQEGSPENIAHKFGVATQSSDSNYQYYRDPANAIDNNLNTFNMTAGSGWLQVALPSGTQISKVVIRNRTDAWQSRLSGTKVYIGTKDFNGTIIPSDEIGTLTSSTAPQIFTFDTLKNGDYILLQEDNDNLHVLEVEVYGVTPATPSFEVLEYKTWIDKWQNKTESIFYVNASDYQGDDLSYTIVQDVPFSIDTEGFIRVDDILSEGNYTFDIVVSDGFNEVMQEMIVYVRNDTIIDFPFRSNDNQPALSGYLPNTYEAGDSVTILINGISYDVQVDNGMWSLDDDMINPPLEIGLYDINLTVGENTILYSEYFEVYGERLQSSTHTLAMGTIDDITVNVESMQITALLKNERVRGSSIRLYVENNITKLKNKSYREIASLLGSYKDENNDSIFVRLNFSENILPYSDVVLSSFLNDKNISIVKTAQHFDMEISFGGEDCNESDDNNRVRYCVPTSAMNEETYSDRSTGNNEQAIYSTAIATYNHLYNSIDGLRAMKAWVEQSTYKAMDYTGDYQSINGYIQDEEKFSYLYRNFIETIMPNHHVEMRSMRYSYASEGMGGGSRGSLFGDTTSGGWASSWEGALKFDNNRLLTYDTVHHEMMHAVGRSHSTGMTYGWSYALRQAVDTLYTVGENPVANVPKYIFETKVLSDTEIKVTVHTTIDTIDDEVHFELLSSTPLINNDFIITSSTDNTVIISTTWKGINTIIFKSI